MNHVGSRWWKFDFHTHTPASMDYGKSNAGIRGNMTHEEWLRKFIEQGIECVAVTDHNSGEWINGLKAEAVRLRGEGHSIYVFPGVEITANSNIHVLAIFDPSKSSEDIHAIIGASKFRGTRGDSDAVAEESAEVIIEEILKSGGIAIPAHIDMKAGLCQLLSSHTIQQVCNKASAMEIIYPISENVHAPLSRYRNCKSNLSEVIGSDAHCPDEVGRAYTYVKMGEPSIEGLRLALIDGKSSLHRSDSIDFDPNTTSDALLHSVTISNAKYAGRHTPLEIKFNPWLNSIIGGRGSGKSSILEFIRIGMGRSQDLLSLDQSNEIRQLFLKFSKKSESRDTDGVMLDNTEISCVYSKQNIFYMLKWTYLQQDITIYKWDNSQWVEELGDAYSRFPIKIFSQKQIFNLAKNPNTLLKLIDESSSVNFQDWQMKWDDKKNFFLRLCEQRRELQGKLSNKNTLLGQLSDIEQKITAIENSGHKEILHEFQIANAKSLKINTYIENLSNLKNEIKVQVNNNQINPIDTSLFNSEIELEKELLAKVEGLTSSLSSIQNQIKQLVDMFEQQINEFNNWNISGDFNKSVFESTKKYNELVARLSEQGINSPAEYQKLIQQRTIIKTNIDNFVSIESEKEAITQAINTTYGELIELRQSLTYSRYSFLKENMESNTSIQIKLEPFINHENIDSSFRTIIGRLDGAFTSDLYDSERSMGILLSLLKQLSNNTSNLEDVNGLNTGLDIIHNFKNELLNYASGEVLNNSLGKRFIDFLNQLSPQVFDLLTIWFPSDKLTIKYHDGNRYKDISLGSAGQKASTILSFLLSYGSEPLILDQPEDDLDNKLITSLLVSKLQENKSKRQIILVTHNPNIVVNGDSEYIIALQDKGQIEINAEGALQELIVRKNVCDIMEGGEIALAQRYKRLFNI
ncbi:TrlF family AAA-like ATPase [Sulfurimonas sp. CS5]|uniref:TrlF family AAA-like ATPase n=1 Tax=Sulfurimonas sp. CS5 TaxID=3391145 RepID=UPI0039ED8AB4